MSELAFAVFGREPIGALVAALVVANLTAAAVIAVVAVARIPARRRFGATSAYHLWLAPPLVFFATALFVLTPWSGMQVSTAAAMAGRSAFPGWALALWVLGALGLAGFFALAHARFLAEVRAGRGGPAVVGLISPRIVLPAEDGYTPQERELVRLHERAHVARKDPRAAALAAGFQCLFWFNPLAHLAAYLLRLDQELACDAAVVLGRPDARALYARTLLKTQLAATPLPFGCYWPARGEHPLEVRIGMLKRGFDRTPRGPAGERMVMASVDAIRP